MSIGKRKITGIIKVTAFLVILLFCFSYSKNILRRKYSYEKYNDFFAQKENFQVLFFGSSHMLSGVFPMQLWEDYGIVSYNMGDTGERIPTSYYSIKMACKENKPKLVVIDAFFADIQEKLNKDCAHNLFDVYPISTTKCEAIQDLCENQKPLNNYFEYLFNLSMYHSRWNKLTKSDFILERYNFEKGATPLVKVATPNPMSEFESVETYKGAETTGMEYLRKIIEYCQENNIEILVTYLPFPATDELIATSKYVANICDEYNVKYINFLKTDTIDYNTDMFDSTSHLNVLGARKVTNYLGNYISKNYNIIDQRENDKYKFWNDDYDGYIDYKIKILENNKVLNNYLMLLCEEKDISCKIEISSNKENLEGSTLQQLLMKLENKYEINDREFEGKEDKTVKITTYDDRTGKEIATRWY